MDDRMILLLLRTIHVLGGIFWVGTAMFNAAFLFPALRATGADGGRVMQALMRERRMPLFLNVAGALTILSGIAMYARISAATQGMWARSNPGMVYGVGAVLAILAAVLGGAVARPTGLRLAAIGQQIHASGGPPSPTQAAEMERLQRRAARTMVVVTTLLVAAATAMATARYL
jgi:hypothetical protein